MDWTLNDNFTVSFVAAFASPGTAVKQAFNRNDDFWYGMVYVATTTEHLIRSGYARLRR